jgi:hypothetical protein
MAGYITDTTPNISRHRHHQQDHRKEQRLACADTSAASHRTCPCPYHKRNFELNGEQAGRCSNDESMNIATFPVEERDLLPLHTLELLIDLMERILRLTLTNFPLLRPQDRTSGAARQVD